MKVDDLFYIVVRDKAQNPYYLKPDKNAASRDYYFPRRLVGVEPLRFLSSTNEKDKKNNTDRTISSVLMDGLGMVVDTNTKNLLSATDVKGLAYVAAIFIDNLGSWHEEYWYLNFFDNLDCWDREKSILEEDEDDEVLRYSFDENIMSEAVIKDRKIFRMAGSTMDYIFMHKDLVKLLEGAAITGVKFLKVSTFNEGDQY